MPENALTHLQRIEALEAQVASLARRLDLREQQGSTAAMPTTAPDGTIPRGKYARQPHARIVQADPDYVIWNADKGYAAGLGFSDTDIQQAQDNLADNPELAHRVQTQKSSRPW